MATPDFPDSRNPRIRAVRQHLERHMIRFTPEARARFRAWLQTVARPNVQETAVESEALDILQDRAVTGETLTYELASQHTSTGRPEGWLSTLADIEAPVWSIIETDAGMPFGAGPTQAAALDDAQAEAYIQTETARDEHPSRDWLLSELQAGRLAWALDSAD